MARILLWVHVEAGMRIPRTNPDNTNSKDRSARRYVTGRLRPLRAIQCRFAGAFASSHTDRHTDRLADVEARADRDDFIVSARLRFVDGVVRGVVAVMIRIARPPDRPGCRRGVE